MGPRAGMSAENLAPLPPGFDPRTFPARSKSLSRSALDPDHFILYVVLKSTLIIHLTICKKTDGQPCPVRNIYMCAISVI